MMHDARPHAAFATEDTRGRHSRTGGVRGGFRSADSRYSCTTFLVEEILGTNGARARGRCGLSGLRMEAL